MDKAPDTLLTAPFSTRPGDYLSVLLSLWLPRYGWMVLSPILLCVVVGCVIDVRFVLIAVMLVFIVIPMLSSFLYPYYMLTPEARRAVLRKQVLISEGNSLMLIYLPEDSPSESRDELEAEDCCSPQSEENAGESRHNREALPQSPLPPSEEIPWSEIKSVKISSRYRVYILATKRLSFILIPHEAIAGAS